jgi:hypothetical protein
VVLLLLPKLASHFVDGTRCDYREACRIAAAAASADQPIFTSENALLETRYYLPRDLRANVRPWDTSGAPSRLPDSEFLLIHQARPWEPPPDIHGRSMKLLAKIGRRRFDEQPYELWVVHVNGASQSQWNSADR